MEWVSKLWELLPFFIINELRLLFADRPKWKKDTSIHEQKEYNIFKIEKILSFFFISLHLVTKQHYTKIFIPKTNVKMHRVVQLNKFNNRQYRYD